MKGLVHRVLGVSERTQALMTALPPEECAARLKAVTFEPSFSVGFDRIGEWQRAKVLGAVTPAGFSLRKHLIYRNSLQTVARGTFAPEGGGARVAIALGPATYAVWFAAVWLGVLLCVDAATTVWVAATLASGAGDVPPITLLGLVPLVMLGLGLAMFRFGSWLARHEADFLVGFVREALAARDLD